MAFVADVDHVRIAHLGSLFAPFGEVVEALAAQRVRVLLEFFADTLHLRDISRIPFKCRIEGAVRIEQSVDGCIHHVHLHDCVTQIGVHLFHVGGDILGGIVAARAGQIGARRNEYGDDQGKQRAVQRPVHGYAPS